MKLIIYAILFGCFIGQSWAVFAAHGDAKRMTQKAKAQAEHFRNNRLKKFSLNARVKRDLTIYRSRKEGCNVNIASNTSQSAKNVNIGLKAKNITVICKR